MFSDGALLHCHYRGGEINTWISLKELAEQPALPAVLGKSGLVTEQIRALQDDTPSVAAQILEIAEGFRESASSSRLIGAARAQNENLLKAAEAVTKKGPKLVAVSRTKRLTMIAEAKRNGSILLEATLYIKDKNKKNAVTLTPDPSCTVSERDPEDLPSRGFCLMIHFSFETEFCACLIPSLTHLNQTLQTVSIGMEALKKYARIWTIICRSLAVM
ncbi:hypothetical protein C8J56DRAFT_1057912 [Mycena floridula]|nr:hypothetical protein C8J56DRAFT_1057912 [Mycena floridula]